MTGRRPTGIWALIGIGVITGTVVALAVVGMSALFDADADTAVVGAIAGAVAGATVSVVGRRRRSQVVAGCTPAGATRDRASSPS